MKFDVDNSSVTYHLSLDQNELQTFYDILSYVAGSKAVYDFLVQAEEYADDEGYKRVQFEEEEGLMVIRLNEEKQSCGECEQCSCKDTKVEYKYSGVNENDIANIEVKREVHLQE